MPEREGRDRASKEFERVRRLTMNRFKKNHFGGSGLYTCASCGKKTRETGSNESSVDLCKLCYLTGGEENMHVDNHPGKQKDCPACKLSYMLQDLPMPTDDMWCDNPDDPKQIEDMIAELIKDYPEHEGFIREAHVSM